MRRGPPRLRQAIIARFVKITPNRLAATNDFQWLHVTLCQPSNVVTMTIKSADALISCVLVNSKAPSCVAGRCAINAPTAQHKEAPNEAAKTRNGASRRAWMSTGTSRARSSCGIHSMSGATRVYASPCVCQGGCRAVV
jgi:hypothetical protein